MLRNGTPLIISSRRAAPSRLIFNEDDRIAHWCHERLPHFLGWGGAYVAIGYERWGVLCGGVVFTQHSPPNIILACVLEAPLTRMFLRAIFYYPFLQLHCGRITVLIDDNNLKSIRLVEHAGFVREGCLRRARPGGDVYLYGMVREDCRWL